MPTPAPDLDSLSTPLAWGVGEELAGCNAAFSRWLGIGARRLRSMSLAALAAGDGRLRRALAAGGDAEAVLRIRRISLRGGDGREHFADVWLRWREAGGWVLEAHPVDEFPGAEPAQSLPSALSAALQGLAHELRNPLAGVKGAAQLLARRHRETPESVELTELIEAEVGRLTGLLDRLLSPHPPRPHVAVNCHGVLERVVRLAESEAGWAVKLARDYDPSLPALIGDADRLIQAIWNLVRNAIQAGASQVSLRTRIEHAARIGERLHARALRLEIGDDGCGVPDTLSERIFLPLVSGRAEGTGLGLALAQQVAREHRGTLTYRSRPGHTVFTLLLPLTAAVEDADAA